MGRFQTSVMVSVLSGALVFGAIGVGATGASAESATTRTKAAPAGERAGGLVARPRDGADSFPFCDGVAEEGGLVNLTYRLITGPAIVPDLPELTMAKLVFRKQRGTVSAAFADKVNEALERRVGIGGGPKDQQKLWMTLARALTKVGDPAVALAGGQIAEAARAYRELFRKLEKVALAWPKNLVDDLAKQNQKSAAVDEARRVWRLRERQAANATEAVKAQSKRTQEWAARVRERPISESWSVEKVNAEVARRTALILPAIEDLKEAEKADLAAEFARRRAMKYYRELDKQDDVDSKNDTYGARDKSAREAADLYNSRILILQSKLRGKMTELSAALDAVYEICSRRPESTDGVDVPSPNAPGKTPAPAATPAPVPTPQQPTTTTTYPTTTTTTDPYCYEHPDLGRICE